MTRKRNKKKRCHTREKIKLNNTDKSTTVSDSIVSISHCNIVQIGTGNKAIINDEQDKHTATRDDHGGEGLVVLKNILKNRRGKVTIKDLEDDLEEILAKGDINSFETLTGMSLKTFLRTHCSVFDIYQEDGITYIGLYEDFPQQGVQSYADVLKGAVGGEVDVVSEEDDQFFEAEEQMENTYESTEHNNNGQRTGKESTEVAHTAWYEIQNKRERRKQKVCRETTQVTKPLAKEILRKKDDDVMISHLKSLLAKSEDADLIFVPSHQVYVESPLRCQRDIVSLWNTPHSVKSYIVIGVDTVVKGDKKVVKHIGSDPDFDDDFYLKENLFVSGVFNTVPSYDYSRIEYDSLVYGMIEVACSCKKGQPSIVKRSYKEGNVEVSVNELWYRNGSNNSICQTADPTTGLIYQWFFGAIPEVGKVTDGKFDDSKPFQSDVPFYQPQTKVSEDTVYDIEGGNEFTKFYSYVKEFKKGHCVLLSGNVSNKIRHLANFALIPLLAVYDFDVYSCTDGLFNAVQDSAENMRQLRISTWKEPAQSFSESSTYWCFMRGRRELSATRTDSLDGTIEGHHEWFRTVRSGIIDNCQQLASFAEEYTVLTVIILWPKEELLVPFIKKYLDRLVETLSHTPNIVVCMHRDTQTETGHTQLKVLLDEYKTSEIHVCLLDYSQLCLGISSKMTSGNDITPKYTLPKSPNDCLPDYIPDKDAMWLKEDLEVLYLQNQYGKANGDEKALEEENNKFYKGGTLHWFAWYANGDIGVDIDRDVLKEAEAKVEHHLDDRKSSMVTVLHAPGSGGSTLAQRIMWNFHTRIPCVHAKAGTMLKSKDLTTKLQFIHDKTQLSILLLIDGEDDAKVKHLCNSLKHTIILHVKRYPFSMKNIPQKVQPRNTSQKEAQKNNQKKDVQSNTDRHKVYLKGHVSPKEAQMLATKFGERCNEAKRRQLQKMKNEVQRNKMHNMYEFGMTVYHHEFKGIVSYVRGYLQLSKDQSVQLLPWQRCLGYLSLVYFYGQTSVPCQFFARLFGKQSNYVMSLDDDFPYPSTEFIVYDTNDRREQTLRICHYEVAKEILEQMLSRHCKETDSRMERLGKNTCKYLAPFAKEFIEYCSNKKQKDTAISHAVRHILTKTFIFRDEIDIGENDEQTRKRPQLSQLLLDIPSGRPMFTERLHILETLSTSFPDDPNYHAHVGRFHAFCGPEDADKAEYRFKRSISLCEDKNKGKVIEVVDDSSKRTLIHVYHMYGVLKKRQISSVTGHAQNAKVELKTMDVFKENIRDLVAIAEQACDFFAKSRELTPDTCEIFTNAYICEIGVRLQICDYVMRHFKPETDANHVFSEFFESDTSDECKVFVEESIPKIETLFMECCHDVDMESDEQAHLRRLVKWFNALFKRQVLPEVSLVSDDEISKRRLKITSLKLDHGGNNLLDGTDNVLDKDALDHIITLYEENFQEIHSKGLGGNIEKKDLDTDYRDWIFAIRHVLCDKTYELDETLRLVNRWHQCVRSPMSTFYLFVIKSVLGFGTETLSGNTEYLLDAKTLKHELSKKTSLVLRPKYPREWLGASGNGIKIIQPGNRKVGLHQHDTKDQSRGPAADLAVCKGTIVHPNSKPYFGQIGYDLKVDTINIYFIPTKASLDGSRYAGQRVEFNLAFTIENGYEAFNVKLLKRHGCSNCSATVEFTSADTSLPCSNCGESIEKDDLNLVTSDSDSN